MGGNQKARPSLLDSRMRAKGIPPTLEHVKGAQTEHAVREKYPRGARKRGGGKFPYFGDLLCDADGSIRRLVKINAGEAKRGVGERKPILM